MDFEPTEDQAIIRKAVAELAARFDDQYWLEKDTAHEFPTEFYDAFAEAGWLGITAPEEYGGHGFGITEASIVIEEVAASGGGMNAASAVHLSIFGLHPVIVHGSEDLKQRNLPRIVTGDLHACFGVTEPGAGLDTTKITTFARRDGDHYVVNGRKVWISKAQESEKILLLTRTTRFDEVAKKTDGMTLFFTDLDRDHVDIRPIQKMGRNAVSSNELFIDDLRIPVADRVGEEGQGFRYILDGLNPERMLVAAEALGLGRAALRRAVRYANEREVFGRPIGMNQGLQFPLADSLARLDAAELALRKATWLYDRGQPCAREANTAKYLCADAGFDAADRALQTHGGMGYAEEYHVARYFREARLLRIAPISQEMVLNYLGSHVLGLPQELLMTTVSSPFTRAGREVLIAEAARTPMGRAHPERGWFRNTHPNVMLAACYTELLSRTGLAPADVEDLVIGCTAPFGEQSRNIGRNAWLQAGYPPEVPAVTLDRRCGSAQTAVEVAAGLIASGTHDVIIAGGVEHMGHVPIDSPVKLMELYGDPWPDELRDQYSFVGQGESAELIADRWQIGRDEMDEFAVRSHQRAAAALDAGRFAAEMIPMELDGQVRHGDQGIRPDTDREKLGRLKPAFRREGGRITAGTSSPLSDGAAGVLLASPDAVQRHGLRARARIVDQTTVGVDPIIMLTGPIPATRKLLDRTGLGIDDLDLIEVNEAFSSVVLAWERELKPDLDRVNVNGGAIALGHPVGASGSRLFATLLAEMERRDVELGLVTMCCGGGLGTATIIQRLAD